MVLAEDYRVYLGSVIPLGTYNYNLSPTGLCISSGIFQVRLGRLFEDLEYLLIYVNDILMVEHSTFEKHYNEISKVFKRLASNGMQVHGKKNHWFWNEAEYLGHFICTDGLYPKKKKIEKILDFNFKVQTT